MPGDPILEQAKPMPEMSASELPILIVACRVLQDLFERALPPQQAARVIYLDYNLHPHPRQLHATLQEAIDKIETPHRLVLGFGLCGNALNGIRSGKHTLLLPRVDDCIPLLLGSYEKFLSQFQQTPATYYLSKGWIESGSQPLQEYQDYLEKYGQEKANWIMDMQYQHIQRLALVACGPSDLEKYRSRAQAIARYCQRWGMRYEELPGSEAYISRLLAGSETPNCLSEDFILIPPGEHIQQCQFIRD